MTNRPYATTYSPSPHRRAVTAFATLSLPVLLFAAPAAAQEEEGGGGVQPVASVELVEARYDGGPILVLETEQGKLRLGDGLYRNADGTSLHVKDGRILEVSEAETSPRPRASQGVKGGRLNVASMEKVGLRMADRPDRLFLRGADGARLVLPSGRFRSAEGHVLVVEEGAIVGYGSMGVRKARDLRLIDKADRIEEPGGAETPRRRD